MSDLPILYTFRRCPYAIRTRYLLAYLNIQVELREVILKAKPMALLELGGRSTVPQLIDSDGIRYPESMDIMRWALTKKQFDSSSDLIPAEFALRIDAWQFQNDFRFKPWLDKYKYADRYPEYPVEYYRQQGERFLRRLELALINQPYLLGQSVTLADILVFPFVRQFRGVDSNWFDQSKYIGVRKWLQKMAEGPVFEKVMKKYDAWQDGQFEKVVF